MNPGAAAIGQPMAAADWAETMLPRSRREPLLGHDPSAGDEPGHADRLLNHLAGSSLPRTRSPSGSSVVSGPMSTGPLHELGVCDLLNVYARGVSPETVLAALRDRLGSGGPAPEAVLRTVNAAEDLAAESARRWRLGTQRPLEGIPFGIKDVIDVADTVVTCGSSLTGDRHAPRDATVVARLRAAGAIPFAMLASSEFACGSPVNQRYGVVPNPHDRSCWAGGSSTGSGAALAAGLLPLALGTDTAGSIRIPSAFCGVAGLKPTRGLVPRTGIATLSWTLDHVGPMARSVSDLARVLPVIAGPDGHDPLAASPSGAAVSSDRPLNGLRVGVTTSWFIERCDPGVLGAWRTAVALLQQAGALLEPVDLPDLSLANEEAWVVLYAELASCQESRFDRQDAFDAGTWDRIARGRACHATDYLRALRRRSVVQRALLDAMGSVDVLLTPGAGAEAARLSDLTVDLDGERVALYEIAARNTAIFNYVGFPALMLPSGRGRHGLPVAVQLVAAPFHDGLCLSVGAALQRLQMHGEFGTDQPTRSLGGK